MMPCWHMSKWQHHQQVHTDHHRNFSVQIGSPQKCGHRTARNVCRQNSILHCRALNHHNDTSSFKPCYHARLFKVYFKVHLKESGHHIYKCVAPPNTNRQFSSHRKMQQSAAVTSLKHFMCY